MKIKLPRPKDWDQRKLRRPLLEQTEEWHRGLYDSPFDAIDEEINELMDWHEGYDWY